MGIMTAEVAAAEVINRLMFWTFMSVVVAVVASRKHISAMESCVFRFVAHFMLIFN